MKSVEINKSGGPLENGVAQIRRQLPVMVLFSFVTNIFMLVIPIYMLSVIDRALSSGSIETLVMLTVIAGVALLTMGLVEAIRGQFMERVSVWLDRRLGRHILSATVDAALSDGNRSSQSFTDLALIRRFISGSGLRVILDAPWMPVFMFVIWMLHPLLGLIAIVAALCLFAIALLNELGSRVYYKKAQDATTDKLNQARALVSNAEVVASMGMLPGFLTNWCRDIDRAHKDNVVAADRGAWFYGLSKFVRSFAQVLVLGGGAYQVMQGEMTTGAMIAASILMGRALAPVEQAVGVWRHVIEARAAWGRLKERLSVVKDKSETLPLPVPEGRISCEQLFFVQPGRENPVLSGINFAVEKGEVLGIIGPSASGKSTLCKVLVGTWKPTRGHMRLDGAEISQWPRECLGPHIGYLPQDVELFRGSITDNIARLSPNPDPEAIVRAAILADVHELILSLPDGYETQIGDAGTFLSGGQRQRIGLARALYGDPQLIVLDEPNASLDTLGERALINAINQVKARGATVILVAHQPYILRDSDKLLVLQDGHLRQFGPTAEILPELSNIPKSQPAVEKTRPGISGVQSEAAPIAVE